MFGNYLITTGGREECGAIIDTDSKRL